MTNDAVPWTVPVAIETVPDNGKHVDIAASEDERAALAKLAGLRALPRLEASFDLSRRGEGLHVAGRVSATVGQICVVTLDPMDNQVDEAVDLLFSPHEAEAPDDVEVPLAEDGSPEPLVGGVVDLGAIATEFLLLGIDPYPRKAGVEFAPAHAGAPADPTEHPFAALQALKKAPEA